MDVRITKEKFIELYKTHTLTEISQLLGVTINQISKQAKKLGLQKRRGPIAKELILED